MSSTIDFWFDFMSPYSYLAHQRLPALAAKYGFELAYKPIELVEVKVAAGNTGPQTREIPPKLKYALEDIRRWAARYGVPFQLPRGMSLGSDALNKGTFFAIDRGEAGRYVAAAWAATYGQGEAMAEEATWAGIARAMGWPVEKFLAYLHSKDAVRRYADTIADAKRSGIFGVPTMGVGSDIWWGNDRLDFLEEHLQRRRAEAA